MSGCKDIYFVKCLGYSTTCVIAIKWGNLEQFKHLFFYQILSISTFKYSVPIRTLSQLRETEVSDPTRELSRCSA